MKTVGCLVLTLILLLNLFLGVGCARICYRLIFGKVPSTTTLVVTAVVGAEIVIPASLVLYVLDQEGMIHTPLVKP